MPTYDYRCPQCGHEYEKLQKISDTSRVACPKCGTLGDRQISAGAGIVFKGSGFYETDYKRAGDTGSKGEKKKDKKDKKKKDGGKKKSKDPGKSGS